MNRLGNAVVASAAIWKHMSGPWRLSAALGNCWPAVIPPACKSDVAQGEPLTPRVLAEEAERGDPLALEIVLETADFLAIGIVNAMHTVDPAGVVIGGAMTFGGRDAAIGRRFLDRVRSEVREASPARAGPADDD